MYVVIERFVLRVYTSMTRKETKNKLYTRN